MELTAMIDQLPRDRRLAILVRHAERDPIDTVGDSIDAALTEAGRRTARALGARLAGFGPLRCFHSPVQRCADTAGELVEGAGQAGVAAGLGGALAGLGGPYMNDWATVMERVLSEGAFRFTRDWFAGRLPAGLAADPLGSARQQLQLLVDQLSEDGWRGCTVDVSHDWNVLLVRRFYLDVDAAEVGWPGYLEGVAASLVPEGLELRWGTHRKTWPLPLPLPEVSPVTA